MRFSYRSSILAILIAIPVVVYFYNQKDPHSFFPRSGNSKLSEKQLDSRLKTIEDELVKNPNNLKLLVDRGTIYFLKGPDHYSDALNNLNAAWQAGALDKRIFYYSGILYENLSMFEEAEKQYERFLRHEPEDREIRLRLARLLFRTGKWEESISAYQRFLEKDPKDVMALINCGLAYEKRMETFQTGKKRLSEKEQQDKKSYTEQGIRYLESAVQLEPNLPEGVYLTLAKLYLEKQDLDKSADACKKELEKSPDSIETLQLLAQINEKMNLKEQALEIYAKLSEKLPQNRLYRSKVNALKRQLKRR